MQSIKSLLYYYIVKRKLAQVRRLQLPLEEARRLNDENAARVFRMPPGVATELVELKGIPGEWLRPEEKPTNGFLLYLHGGAYVTGSIKSHRALAGKLAVAAGMTCLIIDYRRAPESPFPAAVDDALAVYSELLATHPNAPIAVAGDSAGGGLAMALALRIREEGIRPPAALALLSPWTDLTLSNATHQTKASVDPFFPDGSALSLAAKAYAWGRDLKTPLISPQFAELGQLPPTLIHVGEKEALLDDARILGEKLTAQGCTVEFKVYPAMWHVWQVFAGKFREADQSVAEIGGFLKARLAP